MLCCVFILYYKRRRKQAEGEKSENLNVSEKQKQIARNIYIEIRHFIDYSTLSSLSLSPATRYEYNILMEETSTSLFLFLFLFTTSINVPNDCTPARRVENKTIEVFMVNYKLV